MTLSLIYLINFSIDEVRILTAFKSRLNLLCSVLKVGNLHLINSLDMLWF